MDGPHILSDVVNADAECKVNITAVNGRTTKDCMSVMHMTVLVQDREQLENVVRRLSHVKDVFAVHRVGGWARRRKMRAVI